MADKYLKVINKYIKDLNNLGLTCPPLYDFKNKEICLQHLVEENLIKLYSMFEYKNLPDNFTKRHIESALLNFGYCVFIKHDDKLWPMLYSGLCGVEKSPVYDFTEANVANPALGISGTYQDGVNCVIVRNDSLYSGVLDILRRFCTIQVEGNLSLNMWASFGSRLTNLIECQDDDTKKSAEKFIQDIIDGKYSTIASKPFFDGVTVNPLTSQGSGGILPLLELLQYNQAELNKFFGLSSNNNRKRESLSSDETQTDDSILLPFIDDMFEQRKEGIEKINELWGYNIEVVKGSSWELIEEEMEAVVEQLEEEQEETEDEEIKEEEEVKDDETDSE